MIQYVLLLIIAYLSIGCVAESRQVIVNDEFDVQTIGTWCADSLVVDHHDYVWFGCYDTVRKLDHDGNEIATIHITPGTIISHMAFGGPHNLLHLLDQLQHRVVTYTTDRVLVDSLSLISPRELNVSHFVVDSRGIMYFSGKTSEFIWRMNANGEMLSSIFGDPAFSPDCLALDSNDLLYAADQATRRIVQFSRDGEQIGVIVNSRVGLIHSLHIDRAFNMYLSTSGWYNEPENGNLTKLSSTGDELLTIPSPPSALGVDSKGFVYMTDVQWNIVRLDSSLQHVATYRSPWHMISLLMDVVPDVDGGWLIMNNDLDAIPPVQSYIHIASNGSVTQTIGIPLQLENGAIGRGDFLYGLVRDSELCNTSIVKFSRDGLVLSATSFPDDDVAAYFIDHNGLVYLANSSTHAIHIFSPDGAELHVLQPGTDSKSIFTNAHILYVDANSTLYVMDLRQSMLYQFSPQFQVQWVFNFSDYLWANSMTVDAHGDVYIISDLASEFIKIRHSFDDSVVHYYFNDMIVSGWSIFVDSMLNFYIADERRVLILSPKKTNQAINPSAHWKLIVGVVCGSLVLLLAVVSYRRLSVKRLSDPAISSTSINDTVDKHVSRRAHTSRRATTVNFLHHYHSNTMSDSSDDAVYISYG